MILGLETSCDETAAAVVHNGITVRSSVVASQVELHAPFGGVVPEIASRAHVELVHPVLSRALADAGVELDAIDAFAATAGPGLAGALIVGVSAAKALALVTGRPYVGVHHHEAHLFAALLCDPELAPPFVSLIVSGGHTLLVVVDEFGRYRIAGRTVDDAAGEAFDKVARLLGLGYPGGPAIDRVAAAGDPTLAPLPRAMPDRDDFSFSGLKTAVVRLHHERPDLAVADVAAGFQDAVVDVLVSKLLRVAQREGAGTVVIGGGVAANSQLRAQLVAAAEALGIRAVVPARALCTDNAAMVAAAAHHQLRTAGPTGLDGGIHPGLELAEAHVGPGEPG
ncbi:MAG TPA: tRNA (adenosine(37)-N6)-threonylcarbamoyltransferase complex transferase subunit TsaD [Acidimicrobiia bacterium]